MKLDLPQALLSVAAIAGGATFAFLVVVLGRRWQEYDETRDYMSAMGAVGAPDAGAMTIAFVALGLGTAAFAFAMHHAVPGGGRQPLVLLLPLLAAPFMVTAGFVRCDAGCPFPGNTWHGTLHPLVAFPSFIVVGPAPFFFAPLLRQDERWRFLVAPSLFAGAAVLATGILTATFHFTLDEWKGLAERISLGLALLWIAMLSARALYLARSP